MVRVLRGEGGISVGHVGKIEGFLDMPKGGDGKGGDGARHFRGARHF